MATYTDKNASSAAPLNESRRTTAEGSVMHFYQNDHLATELSGKGIRHILWSQDMALVQLEQSKAAQILQVDPANSVLGMAPDTMAYSPYGHLELGGSTALLAFNGQRLDPIMKGYALGNGYRTYSPNLGRFCSPDTLSPFSEGGLNTYAYSECDPINRVDPSGHFSIFKLRTWFRSPKAKISQRLNALREIRPSLQKETEALSTYYKKHIKNRPLDLENDGRLKVAQQNLAAPLARATRKLEGIKKYAPPDLMYSNPEIEAATRLLKDTVRTKISPTGQPKKNFFDARKPKDDPYDDANYTNRQAEIRTS
jgi:RHS repeat-associated protein